MWGWGWGNGAYWHLYSWIGGGIGIIIAAALVVGVVFLVRAFVHPGWHGRNSDSAIDILQKRYARGEITKEQYEEMKRTLG